MFFGQDHGTKTRRFKSRRLLTAANDGGAGPCSVALGQSGPDASASSSPSSTPQSKAGSTPTPLAKTLERMLGR